MANIKAGSATGEQGSDSAPTPIMDPAARKDSHIATELDQAPPVEIAPDGQQRSKTQIAFIMTALCLGVFLAALDLTIITTAIPTIARQFNSSGSYTWIGSAFLLAFAASTPIWGKLSDIWGRKPAVLISAAIFFVGSALCGAAVSITMLIVGRVIQGIGGGGLIILANICIADLFSLRNRGTYYGMIGGVWALASALGPVVGGALTYKVSWRWCFYINLPITAVAFVIILFFLDLRTPTTPLWAGLKAIDWLGAITIAGGTLMLLLGLEFGGITFPWNSPQVICLIVFGIVTLGLFLINEAYLAKYPIMPVQLFNSLSNIACFAVCSMHGMVFIQGSYYLPLYFQAVLSANALLSGVYLLPYALTLSVVSGLVGIWIRKTGDYLWPIRLGLLLMTLGFGLFTDLQPSASWPRIILYQLVAGIGVGPNFQSPLIALHTGVPPRDIAVATATFGFVRNLSSTTGIVLGGVVFQNRMQRQYQKLANTLGPAAAARLSGGSAGANVDIVRSLPSEQQPVVREAFTRALRDMWILITVLSFVGFVCSWAVKRVVLSKTHEETKTGLENEEAKRKAVREEKRERDLRRKGADVEKAG
ncbi:MAG: hypothetical protein M1814_001569 [Vezdaea aestivalis]|nr:MAG: hypothetical protein M1814_001569 [Vezdaea aestivalis]